MDKPKIFGFVVHEKRGKLNAVKRIGEKVHWIYLGEDTTDAEEKIRAYCERNEIELDEIREKDIAGQMDTLKDVTGRVANLERRVMDLEAENKDLARKNCLLLEHVGALGMWIENQSKMVEVLTDGNKDLHGLLPGAFGEMRKAMEGLAEMLQRAREASAGPD